MLPTFFLIIPPTHIVSKTLYEHRSSGGLPKLSPSSFPCYERDTRPKMESLVLGPPSPN